MRSNNSFLSTVQINISHHELLVATEGRLLLESHVEAFTRQRRKRLHSQMTPCKGISPETSTIQVSTFNYMKDDLELYKRTTKSLVSPIEMWEIFVVNTRRSYKKRHWLRIIPQIMHQHPRRGNLPVILTMMTPIVLAGRRTITLISC